MHPASSPSAQPAAPRVPRTLPLAREAFVSAIGHDTPGTDLPRYVAVLDALLAWSAARPQQLAFREETTPRGDISFVRAGTKEVLWSVRVLRGSAPVLEIAPPAGASLTAEGRTHALETLNRHSRVVLTGEDRLRIGFAALKNAAARTAVLSLLDDLLAGGAPSAPHAAHGATEPRADSEG